ncbi:MAG TPA: hypothetical protein VF679_03405, partial [Pedobacter sp.]
MKYIILTVVALFISYHTNAQVSKEQKVANLSTFSKVYGYVRYFHPSEEASKVDWEKFLYYGAKDVENAQNSKVLKDKLNGLFNPIAPSVQISGEKDSKAFDIKSITPGGSSYNQQITWQHYGHGTGPGLYKSIRTNRLVGTMDMKTAGFGNVTSYLDATP